MDRKRNKDKSKTDRLSNGWQFSGRSDPFSSVIKVSVYTFRNRNQVPIGLITNIDIFGIN